MVEQILCLFYLTGKNLTDADVCLFATVIWFDTVYHTFKDKKRIMDYSNIGICERLQTMRHVSNY